MLSSLTAQNQAATVSTRDGNPGAVCFTIAGTFVGTVVFEACPDTVTPVWTAIGAKKIIDETIVASVTAAAVVEVPASGFQAVRARCSAYTSGTITIDSGHVKKAGVTF